MSAPKHLILWAHEKPDRPSLKGSAFENCEFIEVQDATLALQFVRAHQVSVLAGSSVFGPEFFVQAREISPITAQVLLLDDSHLKTLPNFLNTESIFYTLKENDSLESIQSGLLKAISEAEKTQTRLKLRKESSRQNRELEVLNEGLEKIVEERTSHIEAAKTEEEEKLNKVRTLIRFIKELGSASIFEDLLQVLRRETRKFGKLGDPMLILQLVPDTITIYSFQSGQFIKTEARQSVQLPKEFILSATAIRSFLANHFGRPFVKITAIPLEVKLIQKLADTPAEVLLCLENSNSEAASQPLIEFLIERFQPLSMATDRILLEQEHSETAFRWERTFDSLRNPISIVDLDYEVLRANRLYSDRLSKKKCYESFAGRTAPCEGCPLADALRIGKPQQGVIQKGDRIFEVHSYPINLEGGRATNVVNHYVDITQNRGLYIQLLQSEKMGALGLLAGNIAHELNNPLTGLRSLTQVLLKQVPDKSPLQSDLQEIEKATVRSQKIIKNLQEFSNKEKVEREQISIDEIVDRTMPMLKSLLRTHRMDLNLDCQDYLVEVEPQLIQQVVFNLINNACQAMQASSGALYISTYHEKILNRVCLSIRDTGPGISPELLKKIFQPFFTTKKEGHGTGLGLSLSKEIIENHLGEIAVTSTLGEGSEFKVYLPVIMVKK